MFRQSTLRAFALSVLTAAAAPAVARAQYDAASNFSLASNPNGVWSYGTRDLGNLLSTTLTLFTVPANGTVESWSNGGLPVVEYNTSNAQYYSTTVTLEPHQLALHPGPSNEYSIVRFTAPATGMYNLTSMFTAQDCCSTNTDVHVLQDGVALFNGFVIGSTGTASQSFNSLVTLNSGSVVDFVVGSNGSYTFDTTGLDARLDVVTSATPEPASIVLLGSGLLGVFGMARRMKKRQ